MNMVIHKCNFTLFFKALRLKVERSGASGSDGGQKRPFAPFNWYYIYQLTVKIHMKKGAKTQPNVT